MSYPSLAENAVDTLARVKTILADVTSDNPVYYALCELERLAEKSISDGLIQARELASTAAQLKREALVKKQP